MSDFIAALLELLYVFRIIPRPTTPPADPPPVDPPPVDPPPASDRIIFPTGNIKTRMPNGAATIPWSHIARWEPLFTKTVKDGGYNYHPLLLALFAVVESRGNQYTTGKMTGTPDQVLPGKGDPRSKGLLQIRLDLHQANLPGADGMTPEGNVQLGALLLDRWIKSEGSWEGALSNKWHPGTDPASGVTREEYIRFIREAIAEVKASWPKPVDPPPGTRTNPYPKPPIYDLMTDGWRWGIDQNEAAITRKNCNKNRNGRKPVAIVHHIQDGTTSGSLDWWLYGYVDGQKVRASSTVMIQKDGSILNVIPERDGPWTNGRVCSPTPKSAKLRAAGPDPNDGSLTIESEGTPGAPYTEAQFMAILWQSAEWMISHPHITLTDNLSHASIDQCDRPNCPGEQHMLQILNRLKADGF